MSFISVTGTHLSFEFDNGLVLFEDLNFSFGQAKYGLVGPNGVGKTTLIRLLTGENSVTRGDLVVNGTVGILPQILTKCDGGSEGLSVKEVLGIRSQLEALQNLEQGEVSPQILEVIGSDWDLIERVSEVFKVLGIGSLSLNQRVQALSGGELTKLYLARIFLQSPDIVILDEPTNNLDEEGRQAVARFIRNWKRCLIVVSHDRDLLSHVDVIAELSSQGIQFYGGNYSFYVAEREQEELKLEQKITTTKQNEKKQKKQLQQSLERQERRIQQGKKRAERGDIPRIMAGGLKRKAQVTLARVKGTQQGRLEQARYELSYLKKQVKEKNQIQIDIPETEVHSKKELLEIQDFNFRFQGSEKFLYPRSINYCLAGPKRVSLSGPNGAGKTTLIQVLLNSIAGESQGFARLKTRRVAYLDQKMEILGPGQTTLLDRFSEKTPHLTEAERRIRLGRFQFYHDEALKKISALSGGERMRAALACLLFAESPPELLILDEPTNNLDVDSIEKVESALSNFRGAILVISHDPQFIRNLGVIETIDLSSGVRAG
jgi:ATPase subunit of ABC transporter with duplicated ATPase domains